MMRPERQVTPRPADGVLHVVCLKSLADCLGTIFSAWSFSSSQGQCHHGTFRYKVDAEWKTRVRSVLQSVTWKKELVELQPDRTKVFCYGV